MYAMIEADKNYRYSVAWVDSLNTMGRGVLTNGEHATHEELDEIQKKTPFAYDPKALAQAPKFLPNGLLNNWTVGIFNEGWYRKASKHYQSTIQGISQYFHPLDGVKDWNLIYGSKGFLQYQFVVPDEAYELVPKTLERLRDANSNSFLTVLKRFGPSNPAPLSFPQPGWTLAVDIPASVPEINSVLNKLDEEIASAGGKLYLAKDSRQSEKTFKHSYKKLEHWKKIKSSLDPRNIFTSDICKRLKI